MNYYTCPETPVALSCYFASSSIQHSCIKRTCKRLAKLNDTLKFYLLSLKYQKQSNDVPPYWANKIPLFSNTKIAHVFLKPVRTKQNLNGINCNKVNWVSITFEFSSLAQQRHKNYLQTIVVTPLTGKKIAEKKNKNLWNHLFWELELILGPCQLPKKLFPHWTFGSSCLSNSVCKTHLLKQNKTEQQCR